MLHLRTVRALTGLFAQHTFSKKALRIDIGPRSCQVPRWSPRGHTHQRQLVTKSHGQSYASGHHVSLNLSAASSRSNPVSKGVHCGHYCD
eukprot:1042796-Amphidinium_carterae.1